MTQDKAHPTPPAVPDEREAFEAFWLETRGARKCRRELLRHPLQPATYVSDSANRHWVTWQAGARAVQPLAAAIASTPPAVPSEHEPYTAAYMAACRNHPPDHNQIGLHYFRAGWEGRPALATPPSLVAPVASNTTAEPAPIQPAGVEVERDAARYRWLRENKAYVAIQPHYKELPKSQRTGWTIRLVCGDDTSFDAAIDQALEGGPAK